MPAIIGRAFDLDAFESHQIVDAFGTFASFVRFGLVNPSFHELQDRCALDSTTFDKLDGFFAPEKQRLSMQRDMDME